MSFWYDRFDKNSNKKIVRISVLKCFVASWGLPVGFCINDITYFPRKLQKKIRAEILHCKYLNVRSECNDIIISVYSHSPLDPNAKSSDTKSVTLIIR